MILHELDDAIVSLSHLVLEQNRLLLVIFQLDKRALVSISLLNIQVFGADSHFQEPTVCARLCVVLIDMSDVELLDFLKIDYEAN